ncbi:YveK family protein [Vagococcus entomophilus]|uniref:Capsular polysaccharide biosynthesis protein CpsC n=1 Tax=Vagococcus entomophilus TaxID=1160095 RepID=A0A430AIA7_9ENTE|nr:Wzz/FepE/Etk N-terminal domain-containing protein [Vagococcus entomophilus]RSU07852.1 hypothetical protein CBF30_01025 [Vagococcus entomophilus]
MQENMNVKDILIIFKKWWNIILSSVFISIGISAVFTFFILTPKFSSSTQLIVTLPNTAQNSINLNDVNANLMMINTYKDFIQKGNIVTEKAQKELEKSIGFSGTSEDLKKMIHVSQEQNSQMFTITATATKSSDAAQIANTMAVVFQNQVKEVLTNVDKVSVVSNAQVMKDPIFPNKKLMLAVGFLVGLLLGLTIAIILEMLDHTVKSSEYIEETFGLTTLGTVPQMAAKELQAQSVTSNSGRSEMSQLNKVNSAEQEQVKSRNRTRV